MRNQSFTGQRSRLASAEQISKRIKLQEKKQWRSDSIRLDRADPPALWRERSEGGGGPPHSRTLSRCCCRRQIEHFALPSNRRLATVGS